MSFLKKIFGGTSLDGTKLVTSTVKSDYAQIALLSQFDPPASLLNSGDRQRWSRELPHPYDETIQQFVKAGWLEQRSDKYAVTAAAQPFVEQYRARLAKEKAEVMPKVRKELEIKDTSEALDIRRAYEARYPLGQADWTGPEPQMSHSALTRRILYMQHWLLDGLSKETADWLKLYAAEQHMWGARWRLPLDQIPEYAQKELATPEMDAVEAAYWRSNSLGLCVENQETWQRCKGGDHVRRIELVPPEGEELCAACSAIAGKEYLVARTPELPLKDCTCVHGCQLKYEPVLEMYEDVQ